MAQDIAFQSSTSRGNVPVSRDNPLPVSGPSDDVALTKTVVAMDGTSKPLVPADPNRRIVRVSSTATNASAAIDETGGTAALDSGTPIEPSVTITFTGKEAQSAMTAIGTAGNKLTVRVG